MKVEVYKEQELCHRIIGAAIDVHKHLGPGLLESSYEACLAYEFGLRGIAFQRQWHQPIQYKGVLLEEGFIADFLVDNRVIIELKSVEIILSVHESQLLSYLRLSRKEVGLLINFNVPVLKEGIRRKIL
jgi:GxxExxY protein